MESRGTSFFRTQRTCSRGEHQWHRELIAIARHDGTWSTRTLKKKQLTTRARAFVCVCVRAHVSFYIWVKRVRISLMCVIHLPCKEPEDWQLSKLSCVSIVRSRRWRAERGRQATSKSKNLPQTSTSLCTPLCEAKHSFSYEMEQPQAMLMSADFLKALCQLV